MKGWSGWESCTGITNAVVARGKGGRKGSSTGSSTVFELFALKSLDGPRTPSAGERCFYTFFFAHGLGRTLVRGIPFSLYKT